MGLIYEPKGKAREYSPLALNVYTQGCDHQCTYCYCASIGRWGQDAKPRDLGGLEIDAQSASRQVLLSFMSDPYCAANDIHRHTAKALGMLRRYECSVAILTKGGRRCLRDIDIFTGWPDRRIKVGATLTFHNAEKSKQYEPGAALPSNRIATLRFLKECGVQTWASIEPVIEHDESMAIIKESLPWVDAYKVGKLNHRKSDVDWSAFVVEAVETIRAASRKLYVKDDLRPFAPEGFLRPEECDPETVFLKDRP